MSPYKLSYHDLDAKKGIFLVIQIYLYWIWFKSPRFTTEYQVLGLLTKDSFFSFNVKGKNPIAVVVIKFILLSRYKIYIYKSLETLLMAI